MTTSKTVLVTGITGKQGGAVADALLDKGYAIRGLTRDTNTAKAKALTRRGILMVEGDFADSGSLDRATKGVDAVFAMSTPFEAGMEAETAQGKAIADAAKKAGTFLVYTSVASADRGTGIPHFESKYKVEQYIKRIGVKHTILAPVYFMENVLTFPDARQALAKGTYASPLPANLALQQVALADIGNFAALVIDRQEEFNGKRIDLASDTVTGLQEATVLGKALGRPVSYFQVPMDQIRSVSEDFAIMYEWFIKEGYTVDTADLRSQFPEVGWHSFSSWVREQNLN